MHGCLLSCRDRRASVRRFGKLRAFGALPFLADAASPDAPEGRDPPPRELCGSEPGLLPPGLEVGPAAVGHFRLARLFLRALGKLRHETEMNVGRRELL